MQKVENTDNTAIDVKYDVSNILLKWNNFPETKPKNNEEVLFIVECKDVNIMLKKSGIFIDNFKAGIELYYDNVFKTETAFFDYNENLSRKVIKWMSYPDCC